MKYPLFFRFIDEVQTDHVSTIVQVQGSCLIEFADNQWWAEGVQPGGIVGTGLLPQLAAKDFHKTWVAVLHDTANDVLSSDSFRTNIERLFAQVSDAAARDWTASREAIRNGANAEESFFNTLPRTEEDVQPRITVLELCEAVQSRPEKFDEFASAA